MNRDFLILMGGIVVFALFGVVMSYFQAKRETDKAGEQHANV